MTIWHNAQSRPCSIWFQFNLVREEEGANGWRAEMKGWKSGHWVEGLRWKLVVLLSGESSCRPSFFPGFSYVEWGDGHAIKGLQKICWREKAGSFLIRNKKRVFGSDVHDRFDSLYRERWDSILNLWEQFFVGFSFLQLCLLVLHTTNMFI